MSRPIIHTDILLKFIRSGAYARAEKLLEKIHPADIANLLGKLRPAEAKELIALLFSANRAGKTLSELPAEMIPTFLELLDDEQFAKILGRVAPDDAILLLDSVDVERQARVIPLIDPTRRAELDRLLRYEPGTAGSVMTPRFLALERTATAQEAIDAIRTLGGQVEAVFYLYVVDGKGVLEGVVPIRRLVASPPDRPLEQIMMPDPVSVPPEATQEQVAQVVARYNLLAVPVTDADGKLLGIITVDDVIDVIQEEATQDMYRLAGLDEEDRVFSPISTSVRKRIPWTTINLATAFMSASVVGLFEGTIAQNATLAVFMPIVAGLGGNVGSQTLTVITRGIALGEFEFERTGRIILKNMAVGMTLGAAVGAVAALIAWLWKSDPAVGLVLFLAMVANMSIAGIVGASVPVILKLLKKDPALGGSVLITALTDSFGFLAFLGLAKLILGLF